MSKEKTPENFIFDELLSATVLQQLRLHKIYEFQGGRMKAKSVAFFLFHEERRA
ncbi:hypothetical protein [Bacillus clarus]|uniref:Uncharacterized protein n=1 Tax=Bacillus clarus TaxID=2338372 RepID=A0A090YV71_9BACI|nr:hypothetical protein [Bacillus clarus]KFN02310.1 hypothetical protein DJ93_5215 [Bacillus clarus]